MQIPAQYERLQADAVLRTIDRLHDRIAARFPDRNLPTVCLALRATIADVLDGPPRRLTGVVRVASRIAIAFLSVVVVVAVAILLHDSIAEPPDTGWEWFAIIESVVNDLVFAGIAVFFLWQVPTRMHRSDVLHVLHQLRSLAHVIDMHQLTKDPDRLNPDFVATHASLSVGLGADEMGHYLDYCTEMLSLVAKAAALLAEDTTDPAVLATVAQIEDLTNGMIRKIWQKIALINPGTVRPA